MFSAGGKALLHPTSSPELFVPLSGPELARSELEDGETTTIFRTLADAEQSASRSLADETDRLSELMRELVPPTMSRELLSEREPALEMPSLGTPSRNPILRRFNSNNGAAEIPVPLPSPVQNVAEKDKLIASLRTGDLVFSFPESMDFSDAATVELVLRPEGLEVAVEHLLSDTLDGQTRVRTGVDYEIITVAELISDAFEVKPGGMQARRVVENRPAKWSWTIAPRKFGPQLELSIEVYAKRNSTEPPVYVRTFRETIRVDVSILRRLSLYLDEISPLTNVAFALIGGFFSVFTWRYSKD